MFSDYTFHTTQSKYFQKRPLNWTDRNKAFNKIKKKLLNSKNYSELNQKFSLKFYKHFKKGSNKRLVFDQQKIYNLKKTIKFQKLFRIELEILKNFNILLAKLKKVSEKMFV